MTRAFSEADIRRICQEGIAEHAAASAAENRAQWAIRDAWQNQARYLLLPEEIEAFRAEREIEMVAKRRAWEERLENRRVLRENALGLKRQVIEGLVDLRTAFPEPCIEASGDVFVDVGGLRMRLLTAQQHRLCEQKRADVLQQGDAAAQGVDLVFHDRDGDPSPAASQ